MQLRPWITAARLRTLPLTVSNILLGSLIAYHQGKFSPVILILGMVTAILLQILSNYANDYGDFIKKADENRTSRYERALQSGKISPRQMRVMLLILSSLTLLSGISLIALSIKAPDIIAFIAFIITGILCIIAAITYTVGKNPYGYTGMGDISVFIFFGIVGVCGIYILQTGQWDWRVLLPASSFGLLSTGVLNINNIRDIESDRSAGKKTLVVRIGLKKAKNYHACLIVSAMLLGIIYTLTDYHGAFQWLYLLAAPFLIMNIFRVCSSNNSAKLDDELRNLSLTIFLYSVTYGVGLIL
jgi:1,4-dihydroxy-2-naphthoate polyprenyltransferase